MIGLHCLYYWHGDRAGCASAECQWGIVMNRFIVKVAIAALIIAISGVASASYAQTAEMPRTNTTWYNTFAEDAISAARERERSKVVIERQTYPLYGVHGKKHERVLGQEHKYHFKKSKRRHHIDRASPRRNVRGYANAPWNR